MALNYAQLTSPPTDYYIGTVKAGDLIEIEPDGTINAVLNVDEFPEGTKAFFLQSSAPPGWTQDTTAANRAIRIADVGGGLGGVVDFSTCLTNITWPGTGGIANPQCTGTINPTTLGTNNIASHTHGILIRNSCCTNNVPTQAGEMARVTLTSGGAGGNGSHTHGWSFTNVTGSCVNMAQAQLAVKYVDVVLATKDPDPPTTV
jgi:hypothetical protein